MYLNISHVVKQVKGIYYDQTGHIIKSLVNTWRWKGLFTFLIEKKYYANYANCWILKHSRVSIYIFVYIGVFGRGVEKPTKSGDWNVFDVPIARFSVLQNVLSIFLFIFWTLKKKIFFWGGPGRQPLAMYLLGNLYVTCYANYDILYVTYLIAYVLIYNVTCKHVAE